MVRVALTGTPGVGKTTVAALAAEAGWRVVNVGDWAAAEGCIAGHDELDGSDVIDLDALAERLPDDDGTRVLYDSHLAHLLPVDQAWIIRCDPDVLKTRLEARGYHAGKVLENREAEAIDLILQEALEDIPLVIQRDGTRRTPEQLLSAFVEVGSGSMKDHDLEPVDWSDRLPIR